MSYHILIVDDSAMTRTMIKRSLAMAEIPVAQCYEAANGKLGLEKLAANKVDLVFADLHMPEMGGVEMTQRILADDATRHLPVVVISAEPSAQRLAELQQIGVRGCLSKPFTPEALRDMVTQVMEAKHG